MASGWTAGRVWFLLVVLTIGELAAAFLSAQPRVILALLLLLSFLKASLILAYFMHLRSEKRVFGWTLLPIVLAVMLALLGFYPDAYRMLERKP